jgi:acetyltransferase
MTVRNLEYMFKPKSVALIWSEKQYGSMGEIILKNLSSGRFQGDIFSVHPEKRSVDGIPSYNDLESLPKVVDLAVLACPREKVPDLVAKLGQAGTKAVALVAYGFGEGGDTEGKSFCTATLKSAKPHLLRLIGSNSLGLMVPGRGLNASYAHQKPKTGNISFVAQSGTLLSSVLDWAISRNIGFSHMVSLGDMADVDFGDMLDYLASDPSTLSILMYIEAVSDARKFMSAARAAARVKPVIVVKSGRYPESARAAQSHTGAITGSDDVYDAAFRRSGILRVNDLQALFDAAETLTTIRKISGDRLAIITNGGAIGVIATDTFIEKKGHLAELSSETFSKLDDILPHPWSHGNPVDIGADATAGRYASALEVLLDDKSISGILILNCPSALSSGTDAARAVIDSIKKDPYKVRNRIVLTSWLGDKAAEDSRQLFSENNVPTYETPTQAVRGFTQLVRHRTSQKMLKQIPPNIPEAFSPDTDKAFKIVKNALDEQREWLNEAESKDVLSAYTIPVIETQVAKNPEEASRLAEKIDGPSVLKILSPDILHKSDIGGVALDLESPPVVKETAEAMLERIQNNLPDARISGFTIQPMARWVAAFELIVGVIEDCQFGPVIMFGHGGISAEVIRDTATALPPLNMHLAREVISRTRISHLLEGHRENPGAELEKIALTLVKVSQLICDIPEIIEMDINPLLADNDGVLVIDARIKIAAATSPGNQRLAIRPYPRELEETLTLPGGEQLLLRPIRPEDGPAFQDFFAKLSPEDIRFRFLHPMNSLSPALAARLTQIDYDREMALVLQWPSEASELLGVVRITADPDIVEAEFAIMLKKEMTGQGLGLTLMRRIIEYSESRGIKRLYGEVLSDNRSMLKLAEAFGFQKRSIPDDPGVWHVYLNLESEKT